MKPDDNLAAIVAHVEAELGLQLTDEDLTVADLIDRVVDAETYQTLWLDRCAAMHRELQASRGLGQET